MLKQIVILALLKEPNLYYIKQIDIAVYYLGLRSAWEEFINRPHSRHGVGIIWVNAWAGTNSSGVFYMAF